uniref:Uncharacterized protein n=1 Tax=Arundo donax TaxID=35708 RepID=A0A0A8YJD4_ARUDO
MNLHQILGNRSNLTDPKLETRSNRCRRLKASVLSVGTSIG